MEARFWHNKWQRGEIGFNQDRPHIALKKYWPDLGLTENSEVFVPLCGKSVDMIALQKQSHKIIGVEICLPAINDFFAENNIQFTKHKNSEFDIYESGDYKIYHGDFFKLKANHLRNIKAVYDRAALIALPKDMQKDYAEHLRQILPKGTVILLVTLEYDQSKISGPPFSTPQKQVEKLFASYCKIETIIKMPPEDFRGIKAIETIYKLIVI